MLIDFGLMDLWTHDEPPLLQPGILSEQDTMLANNGADFAITGPDAEEAGRKFDRQPHPLFLYDIPENGIADLQESFDALVQQQGFNAVLEQLPERVPPLTRARQAIIQGKGGGEVFLHGMQAIAVENIPTDRTLVVEGRPLEDEKYAGHWRDISLIVSREPVAESKRIGHVAIDMARLMFCDLEAAGKWQHLDSIDGLADFVFWGRDAFRLAKRYEAPVINGKFYGFVDQPLGEVLELAVKVQKHLEHHRMVAATEFRPHSDHWRMLKAVSERDTESGEIELDGSICCGFMTSWGDGFFPVYLDLDEKGGLVAIRIDLGTEETLKGMRLVNRYSP